MKDKISLSINPSYLCNLRCDFCYLSKLQLSSPQVISEELLFERLSTVGASRIIEHVDLYGGEIALIKPVQLKSIIDIIKIFYNGKINVITNLTIVNPLFLEEDITLTVSWDFFAREQHEKVYQHMLNLKKDFHLLILAGHQLITMNDELFSTMLNKLNNLPNLKTVEIKPYSDNSFHHQDVSFKDFENWLIKWISNQNRFNFQFINILKIQDSLSKMYSSWSDDHLYITPDGSYSVLEFDNQNKEFFLKLDNFEQYIDWAKKEKIKVRNNTFCGNCEFLGSCLSEHLQPVQNLDSSCNGFKNLLTWYRNTYPVNA